MRNFSPFRIRTKSLCVSKQRPQSDFSKNPKQYKKQVQKNIQQTKDNVLKTNKTSFHRNYLSIQKPHNNIINSKQNKAKRIRLSIKKQIMQNKKQLNENIIDYIQQIKQKLIKSHSQNMKNNQQFIQKSQKQKNNFDPKYSLNFNNQISDFIFNSTLNINNLRKQLQINYDQDQKNYQNFARSSKSSQFSITKQIQIQILNQKEILKINAQTQTKNYQKQEKYFFEFVKFRQKKMKMFLEIQQKYKGFRNMIQQTQKFKQNYKDLINYIESMPQNDREQRVFALSSDLEKQEQSFKNQLLQFIEKQQTSEINYKLKLKDSLIKQQSLKGSLDSQFKVLIKFFTSKEMNINSKYARIAIRMNNQFNIYCKVFQDSTKYLQKRIKKDQIKLKNIFQSYKEWSKMLVENRLLIFNFIRQIQQIPIMTSTLFGSKQNQFFHGYKQQQLSFEQRAAKFMFIQCEQCYDFKQKIKYLQFKNHQIKPILKSLEWLLRDGNKKISPFSII